MPKLNTICIFIFCYFEGVYRIYYDIVSRERRSVGADKVLFLKTVHHEERADLLFELQDDDGAHALTEDWSEVEWACRQHDGSRSTTERLESGGEEEAASGYALPPEESSTQASSEELDFEALIREACELWTA
jgi:hypothetical protein